MRERDRAFAYLADFASISDWDPGVARSRRITDGEPKAGSRYEMGILPLEELTDDAVGMLDVYAPKGTTGPVNVVTLEQLSEEFDVSRERVRQLEVRAFEKVQKAMQKATRERDRGRTPLMAPTPA